MVTNERRARALTNEPERAAASSARHTQHHFATVHAATAGGKGSHALLVDGTGSHGAGGRDGNGAETAGAAHYPGAQLRCSAPPPAIPFRGLAVTPRC